jgi:hypothetical protein
MHCFGCMRETESIPRAGKIVEPAGAGEDNKSNFCFAKDGKLPGLLEQPISSLGESHLPARWIVNPFYDNLSSPHYLFLLDPQTHVTRS